MRYNKTSMMQEVSENVPLIGEHIESYVCSHNMVTFYEIDTISIKDDKQFHMDTNGTYHYKGLDFKLKDGCFMWSDKKIELPKRTEISTFERVAQSLGMTISIEDNTTKFDMNKMSFRELMNVSTMLALKDLNYIPNSFGLRKQLAYGKNVFEAYLAVVSGSGRVRAKKKSIRWLNEQDTKQLKTTLFNTTDHKYKSGSHSMKYEPTVYAEQLFKLVFDLLKAVDFLHCNMKLQLLDFIVELRNLEKIRLRDVMLLLGDCIGYQNGFIIQPKPSDEHHSRVYSVFVNISSDTRKILGFYNYDIGAALQTICLQLVNDPSLYPLHQELTYDKKAFRAKVQDETGKDLKWVKKELSKINNLDNMPKKYNQYPVLKAYYEEAMPLRKEIVDNAELQILSRATEFANDKLKKVWNINKKAYDFIPDGKKESSIFFFVWTQWERQIRESMMSCFDNPSSCHQVHDAVYSKQMIDPETIEAKVSEDTGFKVQISTD